MNYKFYNIIFSVHCIAYYNCFVELKTKYSYIYYDIHMYVHTSDTSCRQCPITINFKWPQNFRSNLL